MSTHQTKSTHKRNRRNHLPYIHTDSLPYCLRESKRQQTHIQNNITSAISTMVYTRAAASLLAEPPLHLSIFSDVSVDILADLDAPSDSEQLQLLFESSGSGSSQEIVERMLVDSARTASVISTMMDEEMYRMSNSMHDLTFDPVDEHDALAISRRNSLYLDTMNDLGFDLMNGRASRRASLANSVNNSRRGRSPASPDRPRKRISVKDVDFDPIPSLNAQQQHPSHNDLSMSSFNTAQISQGAADHPLESSHQTYFKISLLLLLSSKSLLKPEEQAKYHTALASLAKSMQRTELSRREVMLQRSLLTSSQRLALEEARHRQLQAIQTEALIPVQTPASSRELSPTRSSIVNAFFAGSRGTLTNGLEQSRRQLRNYMSQIQNQTL
jgi:hypothetical protein